MKKLFVAIAICMAFIGLSCNKNDDVNPHKKDAGFIESNQFPLEIGNYWRFRYSIKEIVGDTTIDGKFYYIMTTQPLLINSELINYYSPVDTNFYRNDGTITYIKYDLNTPERKLFDFSLNENESFTNEIIGIGINYHEKVTLTDDSTQVNINGEKVMGKLFSYDTEGWVDEEYARAVNPEIGFLYEFSWAWGLGDTLVNYHLNTITTTEK